MNKCPQCGASVEMGAAKCKYCGENLAPQQAPPPAFNQQQMPQQQMPPPMYGQQPMYQQKPPNPPGHGLSIASMILGILAAANAWYGGGFVVGIIGLILGVIGKKKNAEVGAPTGMAMAGIVLSIISLSWGLICIISCIACTGAATSSVWW
ncbi:MAG: zinc ribbon domain-containing protein [Oscillospiraceae bacterium]|nr:zinc ribbon domain-containing protein [Oscillospiraceae bacterium]